MYEEEEEMENRKRGMGWLPDYPDIRDYTYETKEIHSLVQPMGMHKASRTTLPSSINLRKWCPPIEDQGRLGSCTAHAGVGIVEYYEKRAFGKHIDASRLFLYKATRNLSELQGDTGAFIRSTMGALVLFGVPPEKYWPYSDNDPDFDQEPTAFCYSFAENYKSIRYFRHDMPGISEQAVLESVRKSLAAGIPSMFGFTVYNSIDQAGSAGKIPFPCKNERVLGGHAVVAVGYDDKLEIKNADCDSSTKGAILIRNSWSEGWGDGGYGWLPYEFVVKELALDFWSMLKQDWVDTGQFMIQ
jgi:C1A family cysteine protease